MAFEDQLMQVQNIVIRQKKELTELFGFETRNKYSIEAADGTSIGFAAEQQKGIVGMLSRQIIGHWRSFEILVFDNNKKEVMKARHPFKPLLQRLDVVTTSGRQLGFIQQRFSLINKRFEVLEPTGSILMSVSSPIWKIWTFPFFRNGQEVAVIQKKWQGFLKEGFTDADAFHITFLSRDLTKDARQLLLAAGIFIDLLYFERKA